MGASVVIWGFGSIGERLASYLRPLGASVTGVARSVGERAGFQVVTEDASNPLLTAADALVMVLRSLSTTRRTLDARRLALLLADSPPWGFENVIVTPHAAGSRPYSAKALIEENLRRLLTGESLWNVVGREAA